MWQESVSPSQERAACSSQFRVHVWGQQSTEDSSFPKKRPRMELCQATWGPPGEPTTWDREVLCPDWPSGAHVPGGGGGASPHSQPHPHPHPAGRWVLDTGIPKTPGRHLLLAWPDTLTPSWSLFSLPAPVGPLVCSNGSFPHEITCLGQVCGSQACGPQSLEVPALPDVKEEAWARGSRLLLKKVPWLPWECPQALLPFSEEPPMEGLELSGRDVLICSSLVLGSALFYLVGIGLLGEMETGSCCKQ